jgi:prefoldin subunit 5
MSLFRKEVVRDFLNDKVKNLDEYTAQAEDAVDMVSKTITRLECINARIDETVTEINTYISGLDSVRQQLGKDHKHNAAIISNFSKLLHTEDN